MGSADVTGTWFCCSLAVSVGFVYGTGFSI